MRALRRLITPCDIALGVVVLLAGIGSLYWFGHAAAGVSGTMLVQIDGQRVLEVTFHPADLPRVLTVDAPLGKVQIELREGKARVLPLPSHICPLGICWNSGWTGHPGKVIVCLPNRMVLRILRADPIDGITR